MQREQVLDTQLSLAERDEVARAKADLASLLVASVNLDPPRLPHVVVGELIALADDGHSPLVVYPAHPGVSALRARSVVDLYGFHVGQGVVLSFENGDPLLPIIMGVLRREADTALAPTPGIEVVADGERTVVSARQQLVFQCGKASITLTRAGKVLIQGSYISSRSTGVNRIKGGAVQLN